MSTDDKTFLEAMFGMAVALIAMGFWIRNRETAPRRWPQTRGVIVTSRIDPTLPGTTRKEVIPIIEYEFSYQGKSYKTSHWRWGNFTMGDRESAEAIIWRYPADQPVTVFVNVREPEKSVFEARPSGLCWFPFGFGLFMLLVVILAMTVGNRN